MDSTWQKIPLISEQHYINWWKLNCYRCPKSEYQNRKNGCILELVLCKASAALHGVEGNALPLETRNKLGNGYADFCLCTRLGINDSGLPWSCPEKELVVTELRDGEI